MFGLRRICFACVVFSILPFQVSSTIRKQSNWWFQTHTPEYTSQALDIIEAHRDSITGVYIYFGFAIHANGKFFSPDDDGKILNSLSSVKINRITIDIEYA